MKKNRYETLVEMENSLDKLFDVFGYKMKKIDIGNPKELRKCFSSKKRIAEYMDSLTLQIKEATRGAEDIKLDIWSANEDAREYQNRIAELENNSGKNCGKDVIKSIIALYDSQVIKLEHVKSQNGGDEALRVVESTLKEIENLLKNNGVEVLDAKGVFSNEAQMVVDVKETDDISLAGTIYDTVRAGFAKNGVVLRAQEVIIYKQKEL